MIARHAYRAACASLIALIFLCLARDLWLAPLRPAGSWLVLKALPLLVLAVDCARNDPLRVGRSGVAYVEEIKSPMPHDTLLFGSNCLVG